jgi:proline-specific peptidase
VSERAIGGRTKPAAPVEEGFLDAPGGRMWYRRVGEGGVPLLTLHGGPSIGHCYLEPLAQLADEREVIFFDLLGCGDSDRLADPSGYTLELFLDEIDLVRERLRLGRFHLLGQSWGGILGTYYVALRKPPVASYVVANSVADRARHARELAALRKALPADVVRTLEWHEATGNTACMEYTGAVAEFWRRYACRVQPWPEAFEKCFPVRDREATARIFGLGPEPSGELANANLFPLYETIECPVLFMAGRNDECDPEHMRDMHRATKNSEYVLFENSSHMPFFEEPDLFFASLRQFLRRVDSRES